MDWSRPRSVFVSRAWQRAGLRGNGNGESWGRRVRLDVLPAASEPCPETTYADQILQSQHHGAIRPVII
jgi:hypothetical protein